MSKGALDNITVVDLSRILAGPWASQMLADFGARVIKIEQPVKGDDTRYWGPPFVKPATDTQPPQAAYFHCANRNKQAIAIDIASAEGQQVVKDLIATADVLIENFKVGALAKYGLDYHSVRALNPTLVYCSITGFGQTGPYAHKAGYDAMIQGEGGLMSLTGEPNGEPMKAGVAVVDIMTGLYSCNAILAALMARHTSQQGQYIDMALLDVQVATLANQGLNYLTTAKNPPRQGNGHPNIVPYQAFATQDGSMILAIGNDQQFINFCRIANCPQLSENPHFSSNANRVKHRAELINILAAKLAKQPTQWWLDQLEAVFVPCGPVNTLAQVFAHPQIKHRQMVRQLPDQHGNLQPVIASPINLSVNPLSYHSAAPELGEHSQQILAQQLGYSEAVIAALFAKNIVA